MQIPCVYIPGPAPAVSVANINCVPTWGTEMHSVNYAKISFSDLQVSAPKSYFVDFQWAWMCSDRHKIFRRLPHRTYCAL